MCSVEAKECCPLASKNMLLCHNREWKFLEESDVLGYGCAPLPSTRWIYPFPIGKWACGYLWHQQLHKEVPKISKDELSQGLDNQGCVLGMSSKLFSGWRFSYHEKTDAPHHKIDGAPSIQSKTPFFQANPNMSEGLPWELLTDQDQEINCTLASLKLIRSWVFHLLRAMACRSRKMGHPWFD